MSSRFTLISSVLHDFQLLPFFLRWYSQWGVERFVFGIWGNRHNEIQQMIQRWATPFETVMVSAPTLDFNGERDSELHDRLRIQYVRDTDWYVIADLDEFHVIPGYDMFSEAAVAAEREGATAIEGRLLDRIAEDGAIPSGLDLTRPLGIQFPVSCHLTEAVLKAAFVKIIMARGDVPIEPGHHTCGDAIKWRRLAQVHHFKWFGSVIEEHTRRIASYGAQDLYYRKEPELLVQYLERNQGRIDVTQPEIMASVVENDPLANLCLQSFP